MTLFHGGNLIRASAEFGIPVADWIDLSTGISPWSWPVPPVPEAVWQRLPEEDDGLMTAAAACYETPADSLLAVPGSQHAIRQLPTLWPAGTVALPVWGYREHHQAWQQAGHQPVLYRDGKHLCELAESGAVRHGVVINPCNPTAEIIDVEWLRRVAQALGRREGWLLVDEAFMDPYPALSLMPQRPSHVVVLRSLGKFFGLAGIRLGFVNAPPEILARLAQEMNPWAVSHPARWIGARAMADRDWQRLQIQRLEAASEHWQQALAAIFPTWTWRHTAHFISTEIDWHQAEAVYRAAARCGILLRLLGPVASRGMLRIGLPALQQWHRALDGLQHAKVQAE